MLTIADPATELGWGRKLSFIFKTVCLWLSTTNKTTRSLMLLNKQTEQSKNKPPINFPNGEKWEKVQSCILKYLLATLCVYNDESFDLYHHQLNESVEWVNRV